MVPQTLSQNEPFLSEAAFVRHLVKTVGKVMETVRNVSELSQDSGARPELSTAQGQDPGTGCSLLPFSVIQTLFHQHLLQGQAMVAVTLVRLN